MTDHKIDTLLQDVELGRTALPEIQRGFVWSGQKARDLIDSLYQKYPVGVILLWRPQNIRDFRVLDSQKDAKTTPEWLILDGQQRITSLGLIKQGGIRILFNIDDEIFQIENKSRLNDPTWIRVDKVWKEGSSQILKELSQKLNMPMDKVFEKYMEQIQKIEQILTQNIPVFEMREDDYSRIAEMYVRLNEKGTKLKKAEINLALVVLKFPKTFYEKLIETVSEFEEWELDVSFFLRCFVCVSTNQSKFGPLRKYLDAATEDKVLKDLNTISENLRESFDFITSHFGINQDINQNLIPSNTVMIPIMMYMINNNGRIASASELSKITLWFYCASHYGRFSTSAETTLNEDLREFKGEYPVKNWLQSIKKERGGLEMRELRGRINNTNRFALYYALRLNDALDWWQGIKIEDTSKIEFHHIFPKKILRNAGIPDTLINDIRNIAVVSRKANRTISSMPPEQYFETQIEDKGRIYSQFVPDDPKYWKIENYKDFLEEREKNIIKTLNSRIRELENAV